MTETIYGKFATAIQAEAAVAELDESGIRASNIIFDPDNFVVTVIADIGDAISVRTTIERHGGRTEVDNVPDAGAIPEDPIEFSAESVPDNDWAGH